MKQKDLGKDKKSSFNELSPPHMKFTKEELAKYKKEYAKRAGIEYFYDLILSIKLSIL